jgi:hypothetical protein
MCRRAWIHCTSHRQRNLRPGGAGWPTELECAMQLRGQTAHQLQTHAASA